jgi:hypothetical protein
MKISIPFEKTILILIFKFFYPCFLLILKYSITHQIRKKMQIKINLNTLNHFNINCNNEIKKK